jgi:hypothetical protein
LAKNSLILELWMELEEVFGPRQCSVEAEVCYHSELPTCNIYHLCSD